MKGPLGEAREPREPRDVEVSKARLGPGNHHTEGISSLRLGHQDVADLGLESGPSSVHHRCCRDAIGESAVEVFLDQGERHVDARGDPGRGPDVAITDEDGVRIDVDGGSHLGQPARSRPVCCGAPTVEQPCGSQDKCPGADGTDSARDARGAHEPGSELGIRHRTYDRSFFAAADKYGVRTGANPIDPRGPDAEAARRSNSAARAARENNGINRLAALPGRTGKDLGRSGHVERLRARKRHDNESVHWQRISALWQARRQYGNYVAGRRRWR